MVMDKASVTSMQIGALEFLLGVLSMISNTKLYQ